MGRKIVQIAMIVKNIDKAMENYWKIWALGPWEVHTFTPGKIVEFTVNGKLIEDFEFVIAVAKIGEIQLELIQPVKGQNVYWDFLERNGGGIHHIKEMVNSINIPKVLEDYKKKGIKVIMSGRFDQDEFYYLDTLPTLGFLLEIGNNGKVREPERYYPHSKE
jgi:methylmalonyl-CoA/ethylmalonyl-CoA epimerase